MVVPNVLRFGFLSAVFGLLAAAQSPSEPAAPPAPMPQVLQNYKPITAERLLKPEDGDWVMVRRTYDGWGYSPLAQITPHNVKQLAAGLGVLDRHDQRSRGRAHRRTTA